VLKTTVTKGDDYPIGPIVTTGIQGFAECCNLCRVPFVGHSAQKDLPSAALGKARLSATRLFTECWQRAVNGRPKADGRQSLPRASGWHSAKRILCRVSHI
jgi:hypothetical protein